jgi:NAD(P)-dependent dehydrogenase (short-subunit alcohol dehydrogenase family)
MVHRAERRCGTRIAEGAEKAAAILGDAARYARRIWMKMTSAIRRRTSSEPGRSLHLAGDELDVLQERRHPLLHFGPHSDDRRQHGEDLPRQRIVEQEGAGDEVRLRTLRADFELFPQGTASIPDEEWQAGFALNLFAAIRLTNALLPPLRESKAGAIVNISSGAATMSVGAIAH